MVFYFFLHNSFYFQVAFHFLITHERQIKPVILQGLAPLADRVGQGAIVAPHVGGGRPLVASF